MNTEVKKTPVLSTLCHIIKDDKYLMMHRVKKKIDINKDKWVGIGGHFEPDESPEECLLREAKEETGLDVEVGKVIGVYTDPDIVYPNGDRAQSILIAFELKAVGGELFCDHAETLELAYFARDHRPVLFTKSHEDLWDDIFGENRE